MPETINLCVSHYYSHRGQPLGLLFLGQYLCDEHLRKLMLSRYMLLYLNSVFAVVGNQYFEVEQHWG